MPSPRVYSRQQQWRHTERSYAQAAAALVYGRRKHIINVFVMESSYAVALPTSGDLHGYHRLSWQQGGFTYIAVSDAVPDDLLPLRDLFLKP